MALIPRIVGVMLSGAPSEGDPRGNRDSSTRRAINLTPAIALVLRAAPGTWFTPPDINV